MLFGIKYVDTMGAWIEKKIAIYLNLWGICGVFNILAPVFNRKKDIWQDIVYTFVGDVVGMFVIFTVCPGSP